MWGETRQREGDLCLVILAEVLLGNWGRLLIFTGIDSLAERASEESNIGLVVGTLEQRVVGGN